MFWPIILPAKITFCIVVALVLVGTAIAPGRNWKRANAFFYSLLGGLVLFVPSCIGIEYAVDRFRFGPVEYATFNDFDDFRAQRYLPTAAADIKMDKHANGYRAQYKISDVDFHAYVDKLWDRYGELSAMPRDKILGENTPATRAELESEFADLGWQPLENAVKYHSPIEADGGGATYYFDPVAGTAYQRTGYW